jgi:hypothetical protein
MSGGASFPEREIVERAGDRAEADERRRSRSSSAMAAAVTRVRTLRGRTGTRRFLFENALTLVSFAFFVVSMVGLVLAGRNAHNADQRQHGEQAVGIGEYLRSGSFLEATGENWESAFLQMGIFVLLTRFLYQRGSSESKRIEEPEAVDQDPREASDADAPWPVRRGGFSLALYRNSLSIVAFALFGASLALHAIGGSMKYSEDQREHAGTPVSAVAYIATSQFWFESFQNWQSEFFSVGVLAVLTIWLRQQGSPQSKPVAAPTSDTAE